jgi:hypothetical protein
MVPEIFIIASVAASSQTIKLASCSAYEKLSLQTIKLINSQSRDQAYDRSSYFITILQLNIYYGSIINERNLGQKCLDSLWSEYKEACII